MSNISRRSVLKRSALTAAALSVPWTAKSWANVVGANEDIRIATLGVHGRGKNHTDAFSKMKGVRLVALCDPDEAVLKGELSRLMKGKPSTRPSEISESAASGGNGGNGGNGARAVVDLETDLRKILDNKDIDAISIATPNHWHSLAAIWGVQAGKDVYVEKPVSHNVWEGFQVVKAARRHNKIVQTGTQNRSNPAIREAFAWVRAGNLGKIKVSRGLCYKKRGSIGLTEGPGHVPETVDYDLWLGPAPKEPPHRKQFHYDWHWFWAYGNGDLGNQGIHEMDKARWALGKDHLSPKVMSIGGRFGYKDDGQTPNTQFVVHDYGDSLLIFEVRGLTDKPGNANMPTYRGQAVGNVVECEHGYLTTAEAGGRNGIAAYDNDDNVIKRFTAPAREEDHFGNFIKAVRSRRRQDLNADILEGHLSSALCHTGNISYRLGQPTPVGEIHDALKPKKDDTQEAIRADKAAMETFARFVEHLEVNGVSISAEQAVLGPLLEMDPRTETFVGNDEANKLLTSEYRKPFVVPENV